MDPQERLVGFSMLLSPSDWTHCICIKLNLIDNFNISTLNKKKYALLHAFNTIPLWSEKK
jgi:hypothetical protein